MSKQEINSEGRLLKKKKKKFACGFTVKKIGVFVPVKILIFS